MFRHLRLEKGGVMDICVIGAGPSGLCTIKELLDEKHTVTCFEKNEDIGGVFFYSHDKGGVYDSTILTVSNYFMAFSSYPPSMEEGRHQWTRIQYTEYLKSFTKRFELSRHIHFNTQVTRIDNHDNADKYWVTTSGPNGESKQVFDAIAICTGTHQIAKTPTFSGQEKFQGEIIHSESYKNAARFCDKNVVCIGVGESSADISHEISLAAKRSMLSMRRYPWVISRYIRGFVNDAFTARIFYSFPLEYKKNVGVRGFRKRLKNPEASQYASWDKMQLLRAKWNTEANNRFRQYATKNEIFLTDIAEGRLEVNVGGIDHLTEDSVVFKDGQVFPTDILMCCTGYQNRFSFLEHIIKIDDIRDMYKHMIHPKLGSRIAFMGWARPATGGIPACSEMQSRYFALLCSGKRELPPKEKLAQIIEHDRQAEEDLFCESPHVRTLVDWHEYMDYLGKQVGCAPHHFYLDPILFFKMWYGAQLSYHYRLRGPHAQPKIAKSIIKKLPVSFDRIDLLTLPFYSIYANTITKVKEIFRKPPSPMPNS